MTALPRLRKYVLDLRSFPRDAGVAWRSAGGQGVWSEFRRRTLDRVAGYTDRLLIETDLSRLANIPTPDGVEILAFSGPDWSALGPLVRRGGARQAATVAAGRLCLVAWREARAIGFVWLSERMEARYESYDLPMPADAVYVWQIEVISTERERGVAASLAVAALRHAQARGCRRSWVIVHPENRASLRTVARVGQSRVLGKVARIKVLSWMRSHYRELREPLPIELAIPTLGQ